MVQASEEWPCWLPSQLSDRLPCVLVSKPDGRLLTELCSAAGNWGASGRLASLDVSELASVFVNTAPDGTLENCSQLTQLINKLVLSSRQATVMKDESRLRAVVGWRLRRARNGRTINLKSLLLLLSQKPFSQLMPSQLTEALEAVAAVSTSERWQLVVSAVLSGEASTGGCPPRHAQQ